MFFVTSLLSSFVPGSLSLGALRFNLAKEKASYLLLGWEEVALWLVGMWGQSWELNHSLYQCLSNVNVFTSHLGILLKYRPCFNRSGVGLGILHFLTSF